MSASEVVGLELDDARTRLAERGLTVRSVAETRPPRPVELTGRYRVVRVRQDGSAVDLVVTRERYVPRG
ncbi:MAG: hypothetical protein QN141_09860 [Armatimonadota bacterium]|nr:hypothetical protein [Armatimonadota bacterium]MDR7451576.1 hypothetical protein [Armatimonadota bacterium]MDR7467704.1 hypothetical protein [Armatimonadota bacterium]MDR7492545.1 hypothetical protein [Armatimonadota bacterium]MDR7500581.1 hypothetical protein [Armatimonadota bacterium]